MYRADAPAETEVEGADRAKHRPAQRKHAKPFRAEAVHDDWETHDRHHERQSLSQQAEDGTLHQQGAGGETSTLASLPACYGR